MTPSSFPLVLPLVKYNAKTIYSPLLTIDKRQEKLRLEAAAGPGPSGGSSGGGGGTDSPGPTRHPTEEMDVDTVGAPPPTPSPAAAVGADKEGKEGKEGKDTSQHPPGKKYRLTESMKAIVWQLVLLSNECCRLENEKKSVFILFGRLGFG